MRRKILRLYIADELELSVGLDLGLYSPNRRASEYPVVMLAIERSERGSITTGKAVQKNVAGGDPLDGHGYWVRLRRRHGWAATPGVPAYSLASLVSLAGTPGYSDGTLRVLRPHQQHCG